MFSRKKIAVSCATLVTPLMVGAEAPPASLVSLPAPQASSSVAEEIRTINEEIAVLSAQLKRLEIQRQISAAEADMRRSGGSGPVVGSADAPAGPGRSSPLPTVRSIEGADNRLRAELVLRAGARQTVMEGDHTAGGWRVARITPSSVTVRRGDDTVNLAFGSPPAMDGSQAYGMSDQGF